MQNSNSNTATPRPHSPYSPSRLEGISNCDFYLPENDYASEYAEEGQLLHDRVPEDQPLDDLSAEQADAVRYCREAVRATNGRRRVPGRYEVRVELPNNQWGYIDFVSSSRNSNEVRILDFKFGFAVADASAKYSAQLQAYALGIWDSMPKCDRIVLKLVKARLRQTERAHFNRNEHYAKIRLRYDRLLRQAKDPRNKRVTSRCAYCTYNARCNEVLAVVKSMEMPSAKVMPIGPVTDANLYSPSTAARILTAMPTVTAWMKRYKEHVISLAEDGIVKVPGFEIKRTRVHETVHGDLAECIGDLDLIVAGRKITAEDAREAAKYTLGNTVKTLSEETANGDPDTAKALRKALEPLFPAKTFSSIKKIS